MKTCKKVTLKAKEGIKFEITEGENQQIFITAYNSIVQDSCLASYTIPPIPEGYKYVEGKWYDGFVIERKVDGSQFVWVPTNSLKHKESLIKCESVKKYGGFYISRFNISKSVDGKPQSVRRAIPWTNITHNEAKTIAESIKDKGVESHLMYKAEYETILYWFIETGAASNYDIFSDSSNLGNYRVPGKEPVLTTTGSNEDWKQNNIYDFIGNVCEWTQDNVQKNVAIWRGGGYKSFGVMNHASTCCDSRHDGFNTSFKDQEIGFRIVLDVYYLSEIEI